MKLSLDPPIPWSKELSYGSCVIGIDRYSHMVIALHIVQTALDNRYC